MSKKRQFLRQHRTEEKLKKAAPNEAVWLSKRDMEVIQRQMVKDIGIDAICKVMIAAACVITNHWGAMNKKETRLKVFCEKYQKYLEHVDKPTEEMQAVEKLLDEQVGLQVIRENTKGGLDHDEN